MFLARYRLLTNTRTCHCAVSSFPTKGEKRRCFPPLVIGWPAVARILAARTFFCTSAYLLSEDIFKLKMPVIFTHSVSCFFSWSLSYFKQNACDNRYSIEILIYFWNILQSIGVRCIVLCLNCKSLTSLVTASSILRCQRSWRIWLLHPCHYGCNCSITAPWQPPPRSAKQIQLSIDKLQTRMQKLSHTPEFILANKSSWSNFKHRCSKVVLAAIANINAGRFAHEKNNICCLRRADIHFAWHSVWGASSLLWSAERSI